MGWRILIFLLLCGNTFAQNIIINGGFEEFKSHNDTLMFKNSSSVKHVEASKNQNFDFFSQNQKYKSVPNNLAGHQIAADGNSYIGISITGFKRGIKKECPFRTFVQMELSERLEENRIYDFSCKVSLADLSGYAGSNFGVVFCKESYKNKALTLPMGFYDIELNTSEVITDTSNWVTLTGKYRARGDEVYLLFGNFSDCNYSTRKSWNEKISKDVLESMKNHYSSKLYSSPFSKAQNELSSFAYYYVDDLQLHKTDSVLNLLYLKQEQVFDSSLKYTNINLVEDGSFDKNKNDKNLFWINPSQATPDFRKDNTAGLYIYSKAHNNNREYIACKLNKPLQPCKEYILRFKIRNSKEYRFMGDKFQVAISKDRPLAAGRSILDLSPVFSTPSNYLIDKDWITVKTKFKPDTCAEYLVFGNFETDNHTFIYPFNNIPSFAYYIIDDIGLFEVDTINTCAACIVNTVEKILDLPQEIKTDSILVFYEVGSIYLSIEQSNSLKAYLEKVSKNAIKEIYIEGHADSTGNDEINIKIARDRANEVAQYLEKILPKNIHINIESFSNQKQITLNERILYDGLINPRRVKIIVRYSEI